jgi:hypothetical protein
MLDFVNPTIGAAAIAALALLVGALVTQFVSSRLKISEFRQRWIEELRKDIADYLGATQRHFMAYAENQEPWKLFKLGNESSVIFYRIKMRINPNENKFKKEDDEFISSLERLRSPEGIDQMMAEHHWAEASEILLLSARKLLKREWDVTKKIFWRWSS